MEPLTVGTKVLIQDRVLGPSYMTWKEEGVIMEERQTRKGSPQSYWILTSSGRLKLRSRKFLRPFVMEEADPVVLKAQAVSLLTLHIADAIRSVVSR